ncbi:hypothetical protein P691DRAFT_784102 [Macrolepiota fuliginosa MF-IS2]|uniref:Uncharacterized protein n=1 Tax=Macrolepiota fuliginosa MF-IS2 TaxID=1400762 RepID=A0A9P5X7Z5_9AGAR|nr:hypothetical protein P691DRAFT_784102 [Macrolepiota fuliginosa MF-IS2]
MSIPTMIIETEQEVLQLIATNALRTSAQYTSVSLLSFLACPEYLGRKMGWHKQHILVVSVYTFLRYFVGLVFQFSKNAVLRSMLLIDNTEHTSPLPSSLYQGFSIFGLMISECSFILRAYALWGASRRAAAFFSFLAAGMVCSLVVDALQLRPIKSLSRLTSSHRDLTILNATGSILSACDIDGPVPVVALSCQIITLVIDTVIMCMVIWGKIRKYYAHKANVLLKKIYQDAVKYFCGNCLRTSLIQCLDSLRSALVLVTLGVTARRPRVYIVSRSAVDVSAHVVEGRLPDRSVRQMRIQSPDLLEFGKAARIRACCATGVRYESQLLQMPPLTGTDYETRKPSGMNQRGVQQV